MKYQFSTHTHTHIGKLVPLSPVRPTIPNGKGAANQGPDRVGIPLIVDPLFGASTLSLLFIYIHDYCLVPLLCYDACLMQYV